MLVFAMEMLITVFSDESHAALPKWPLHIHGPILCLQWECSNCWCRRIPGTKRMIIQGWAILPFPDLVKFVPAVAYHFCQNLPATFSQPWNGNWLSPLLFSFAWNFLFLTLLQGLCLGMSALTFYDMAVWFFNKKLVPMCGFDSKK